MQEIELPTNIEARVYVTKLATTTSNSIYFLEVPLLGENIKDLQEGRVEFDGLKFDSTSYNHGVIYFKLREASSI